jgi:hypothetical protein
VGDRYTKSTLILPVSQVHDDDADECGTQTFCGRLVNDMVDLSLIASWHKTCTLEHQNSVDSHGCSPQTHVDVQDFRLIDVQKRCVVRANAKVDYAALSYVWGNAKRLTLSKHNEAWLSTPGALAQDEENVPKTFRDALKVAAALGIANLWVDALCIDQGNPEQVTHHMDAMNTIYGSAILTIVSTAENANSGLPGISFPRGPPQVTFQYNGTCYLSSKPTFGTALQDSPWEKRAWCLQEKLFSARLLVFTDNQAFYHCGAATWFEDTIMELKESLHGAVQMREKTKNERKSELEDRPSYPAYDTHRTAFEDRNFWSLVQSYSQREISYEEDVIRAFGGILRSVEADHGHAIWGIPQYHFLRGLSWYQGQHQMSLRREGFPSWSWAGWRTHGIDLSFANCKRKNTDIGVSYGRYRVARGKQAERSVWDLSWYYHANDEPGGQLRAVQLEPQNRNVETEGAPLPDAATEQPMDPGSVFVFPRNPKWFHESRKEPESLMKTNMKYKHLHEWDLLGHPETVQPTHEPLPPLVPGPEIPKLSHILRFYTSVATVLVHPGLIRSDWTGKGEHPLLIPGTDTELARVELDPLWSGIGKTHSLVYISRHCREYITYEEQDSDDPEKLHLLLVESVPGWGEVKSRVQLVQEVSILDWRKANPRWELVNLG